MFVHCLTWHRTLHTSYCKNYGELFSDPYSPNVTSGRWLTTWTKIHFAPTAGVKFDIRSAIMARLAGATIGIETILLPFSQSFGLEPCHQRRRIGNAARAIRATRDFDY